MHEDFRSTKGAEDPCAETQRALCTYLWIIGSADHAPGASGLWNMFVVDMARLKAERRRKVKWESEMLSQQYLDDFVPMVFRTTNQINGSEDLSHDHERQFTSRSTMESISGQGQELPGSYS